MYYTFPNWHVPLERYRVTDKVPVLCTWHSLDDDTTIQQVRYYSQRMSPLQIQQCIVRIGRRYLQTENFTARYEHGIPHDDFDDEDEYFDLTEFDDFDDYFNQEDKQ